jgi:DNA-binding NtrC family response regulator
MNRSANPERILAVDDSPDTLEVLRRNLTSHGYEVLTAPAVADALRLLAESSIDVVITDFKMPGASGLDLVRHVRDNHRATEVLMITGYASVENAVEAVRTGADNYLSKPFTDDELLAAVESAVAKLRARKAMSAPARVPSYATPALLGECAAIREVARAVDKALTSSAPVLLMGERGTGLEAIARALHYGGPLASRPFVPVHCEATPADRLGAELFGDSTPGKERLGLVHAARTGTLFLDEVFCAQGAVQADLDRMLRENRLPGRAQAPAEPAAVRVIASSSREPKALLARGMLHEPLLYALNVIELRVPPLRDRGEDVLLLARHFAGRFAAEQGLPEPSFSDRSLQALRHHTWPGNLMELENTMQRLVVMADDGAIDVPDLPGVMRYSALHDRGLDRSLSDVESEHIRNVVRSVHGNQTRAALILGIDRKTLREKMKRINRERGATD